MIGACSIRQQCKDLVRQRHETGKVDSMQHYLHEYQHFFVLNCPLQEALKERRGGLSLCDVICIDCLVVLIHQRILVTAHIVDRSVRGGQVYLRAHLLPSVVALIGVSIYW